jgi:alkyl sulfatase BDS1-like metallo-beta-lactamase superfamily hydrolase
VIAPEGFMEEATSENILAGLAMQRRAQYMYGSRLPRSATGHVDTGLGKQQTFGGDIGILEPTEIVSKTGQRIDVDGVEMVFQYTPASEAPAEMTFYIPQYRHSAAPRWSPTPCTTSTPCAAPRYATR